MRQVAVPTYILRAAAAGPPPRAKESSGDSSNVGRRSRGQGLLEGREEGAAEGRRADGRASRKKEQLEAK